MITKLSVSNFKSIRQLDIDCKKVNLFIGEPNTGKSNILEALALLSWCGQSEQKRFEDYVRCESMQYLFYDGLIADQSIGIKFLTTEINPTGINITFNSDIYEIRKIESDRPFRRVNSKGIINGPLSTFGHVKNIQFFRFKNLVKYNFLWFLDLKYYVILSKNFIINMD